MEGILDSVAAHAQDSKEYVGSTYGQDYSRSSGHGHSGGHSGYGGGHSGGYNHGHSAHGGHSSGYGHSGGHSSGYGKKEECCPLVVDLLCLAAILASIAAATVLLGRVIQIQIMTGRRRKRSLAFKAFVLEGKPFPVAKSRSCIL